MTVRKRTASSTAHLLGTDLSDDAPIYSSPIAKRTKHNQKSNKVGDGWLWRPSRAKVPSPNTSPLPLHWEKSSPPKPAMKAQPPSQMEVEYSSAPDPSSTVKSSSYTEYSDQEEDTSMTAGHTPGPGKGSGSSIKDLKTVTKRLKSLDDRLSTYPQTLQKELASLKENIHALEERTQRNEIRAAIRHDIIFDALKKISQDVNQIRDDSHKRAAVEITDDEGDGSSQVLGSTEKVLKRKIKVPMSPGRGKTQNSAARKTMERCLNQYMDKMNNAASVDEVKQTGSLCKQYAEDLIKTYI